ncbi:hypothetical protein [Hugenholtzia roseola]|uniref:transmembrane-type terpene cyclase n=1 Tax=Hugenholtzia roseola TaxID=1002 RepID=UPI00041E3CF5|nr:hypothetical protein [Hugenholtzia roseola]
MEAWINLKDYTLLQQSFFILDTLFWLVVYVLVEYKAQKYKYVGIPAMALAANIGWEFVWSWVLVTDLGELFVWGARLWFFFDVLLFYRLMQYGDKQISNFFLKKYFKLWVSLAVVMWAALIYTFTVQFGDPIGGTTGYILNLMMSILFIVLFLSNPKEKALSLGIAWCKMIGTVLIVISFWVGAGEFPFVTVIGIATFLIDLCYIALLSNRQKIVSVLAQNQK